MSSDSTAVLLGTGDVLDAVPGLSFRRLDHWRRCGVVTPVINATGSGHRAYWTKRDIGRLKIILRVDAYLRQYTHGLSLDGIKRIWDTLEHQDWYQFGGETIWLES